MVDDKWRNKQDPNYVNNVDNVISIYQHSMDLFLRMRNSVDTEESNTYELTSSKTLAKKSHITVNNVSVTNTHKTIIANRM